MKLLRSWLLVLLTASGAFAQDADSLLIKAEESILSTDDSLSIFALIDSLLQIDDALGSQLALRIGYNSNVLSAGRTLGIENFGLSPGVSYYHKSGLYADLSGYWSKDFEPAYYLTIVSLGYMHDFSKHLSIMAGYDRYFYKAADDKSYIPYKNTLTATPIVEFKPVSLSASYSFYFGDQHAHRLMPGISITLEKRNLLKIHRIAIMPSFFMLWGNETVTEFSFIAPASFREARRNRRLYGTRFTIAETTRDIYGIMNYAISVPLSISHNHWGLSFTLPTIFPKHYRVFHSRSLKALIFPEVYFI